MLLPGMSFENDWTGVRIRDIKANLSENPDGVLMYSETRRPVTHVLIGETCGYSSFISSMPGEPHRPYVFADDIEEAYRRLLIPDPEPMLSPGHLAMAQAHVAWAQRKAPHLLTPWLD